MTACARCGLDIVYRDGAWKHVVGSWLNCELAQYQAGKRTWRVPTPRVVAMPDVEKIVTDLLAVERALR